MEWTENEDIGLANKCLFCRFCKLENNEFKCLNKNAEKYNNIITNKDTACDLWRYAL